MSGGLLPGRFADSLLKNPPATPTQMLEKAEKYIKLEEFKQLPRMAEPRDIFPREKDPRDRREAESKKRPRSTDQPNTSVGRTVARGLPAELGPIDELFFRIKDQLRLNYPAPMRTPVEQRDRTRYCDFHQDVGHRTAECRSLALVLEQLHREGKLRDLSPRRQTREKAAMITHQQGQQLDRGRRSEPLDSEPVNNASRPRTIYVIHAETPTGGTSASERKRNLHHLYSLSAHPAPPPADVDSPTITFSEKDRYGIQYPHDDALVISVVIGAFDVRRVLVDNGSSANILFERPFLQMSIDKTQLSPTTSVMSGFAGETNSPLGTIQLPVRVGEGATQRTSLANFFIVRAGSPYNAILGRTWLHDMKALASSYHQCIKYPIGQVVGTIVGDHIAARECLTTALKHIK